MYAGGLSHISAGAWVPEQLTHYVEAVSGRTARLCGGHAAYIMGGQAALAAYPLAPDALASMDAIKAPDAMDTGSCVREASGTEAAQLSEALEALSAMGCDRVTILAPFKIAGAAVTHSDHYWQIALPCPPERQKLRNLLRRAAGEASVGEDAFGPEHQALVAAYLAERPLPAGTRSIFAALPAYARLSGVPGLNVRLYSARRHDGALAGFTIGDFTGLHTAFYMFAFRARNAPPGTADLLLRRIIYQAEEMGHQRLNLGLGVNPGIAFFKQKWGASPLLPYVESAWRSQGRSGGGAVPSGGSGGGSGGSSGGSSGGILKGLRRLLGGGLS